MKKPLVKAPAKAIDKQLDTIPQGGKAENSITQAFPPYNKKICGGLKNEMV